MLSGIEENQLKNGNHIHPLINNRPVAIEEEKTAKISIWWDIQACQLPEGSNPRWVINNFMQALRQSNFLGEISIFMFGDAHQIDSNVEAQLNGSGLTLNHMAGGRDAIDRIMIVRMLSWANDNPPPANILVISGEDFWHTLPQLKVLKYNIMLAHQRPRGIMNPVTDIIWKWSSLLSGELPEPVQQA